MPTALLGQCSDMARGIIGPDFKRAGERDNQDGGITGKS